MSKEHRVDPQVTVGLLTTATGFPLEVDLFEGNKAETKTLIPVLTRFRDRHQAHDIVVVADAGMLSAANLLALEDNGFRFIVGSKTGKIPYELEAHVERHGNYLADGATIETTRRMGTGKKARDRRVACHYAFKRAQHDNKAINAMAERAEKVASGERPLKKDRFVTFTDTSTSVNWDLVERARSLAGIKGYVTSIDSAVMDGPAVVAAYHDLYQVEMVFPQLTKGAVRPVGRGREHVADVDLVICDDHAVDEQLGQLPPLLEGSSSQAGPVAWQNASMPSATACSSILCVAAASSCRCWASKVACRRSRSWRLRWSSARVMTSAR